MPHNQFAGGAALKRARVAATQKSLGGQCGLAAQFWWSNFATLSKPTDEEAITNVPL